MKKNYILFSLCYTLTITISLSQNNLVHNPGFESVSSNIDCTNNSNTFGQLETYWGQCSPWTVPYRHTIFCAWHHSVGTSDIHCIGGNFGPHFGFAGYHEYITAPLTQQLVQGKYYFVQFYYRAGTNPGSCGVKFFTERPEQCATYRHIRPDGPADVEIPKNPPPTIWPASGWIRQTGYFIANDYYDWITLGQFNTTDGGNSNGNPGLDFDDIYVYEVGPNFCPPYNSIQNWTFEEIGEITFRSSDITISGTMVDNQKTFGDVVVKPTGIVTFKSETEVVIAPEFAAEYGCEFKAVILPCGADCFPPTVNAGDDISACGNVGGQYTLGTAAIGGQSYNWSVVNSTDPNALSYLSATNVANPVFTTPQGVGLIYYALTVTNDCGQTATDYVLVSFDDNGNSTPASITLSNVQNTGDYVSFDVSGYNISTSLINIVITDENGNTAADYQIENPYAVYGPNGFNWVIPDYLSNCHQYTVNVNAENYCTQNAGAITTINWNPPSTPVITLDPNVFSPNCSPPNDVLDFTVNSASKFTVYVYTNSGSLIYKKIDEPFTPPTAHVWDGTCNTFSCNAPNHCGNLDIVGDGTYYIVVTFSNDCDPAATVSVAHDVELFGPGARRNMHLDSADAEISAGNAFNIFPNPSHESFTITSADLLKGGTLHVVNMLGQEVHKEQIAAGNSSSIVKWNNLANGVYYLEFVNEQTKTVKRIIKE